MKRKKTREQLYELLKEFDPASAEKINQADLRRIIRSLEVFF